MNSHNYEMKYLVAFLCMLLTGCFGDEPFLDIGTDSTSDALSSDTEESTDLPIDNTRIELYSQDYIGFEDGNDSWGPAGTPPIVGAEHPGYQIARCFDCHAQNKPFTNQGHDPKMQYWAWSCARGFPGGACHGHGVNGTFPFNHERDDAFADCTKAGCHDTFNAERKDFENHGMNDVPTDEFCHACHDYSWSGWPEGDFI